MNFDPSWLSNLKEFQKKAMELARKSNSTGEVQDLVNDLMKNWGVSNFTWSNNQASNNENDFNRPPAEKMDSAAGSSNHGSEAILKIFLPGVAGKDDLTLNLLEDILCISGKSSQMDGDGTFNRIVRLPFNAVPSEMNASYESGYLNISLIRQQERCWRIVDCDFRSP